MVDIGKLKPDWMGDYNIEDVFDPNLTFNRSEWLKEENYLKFVKQDENFSIGGLNPGNYRLIDESWTLTLCSSAETEDEVKAQLALLPHAD